jgi:hypothetical protein
VGIVKIPYLTDKQFPVGFLCFVFRRTKMSVPLKPDGPCFFMLTDGVTSKPVVFKKGCYICEDPEFALMGLPLYRRCPKCKGHIAADDTVCDDCGYDEYEDLHRDREEAF